jgi:aspartyl-tRNA(Asn)/glutamyl-tRNA(Gln) amidotransferase subunit A
VTGGADDLAYLSIARVSALFRSGQLSPLELTRALIERTDRLQQSLAVYATFTPEIALAQAKAAQEAFRRKDEALIASPLLGIPIAYKDIVMTRGVRTSGGSALHEQFVPEIDATVVRRWGAAGAVMMGKLITHEFALSLQSSDHAFRPARNPWNTAHIPGGSSSGSGAALAAGLVLGAIGTDSGGSIRNPASFCAVSGLKPTYGRVSRHGVFALSWSLDHVGPMARSVEDTALLLNALAGHDPADPASANVPVEDFTASLRRGVRGLRIGIPTNFFFDGVAGEVREAVYAAAERLSAEGADVREMEAPDAELSPSIDAIMLSEAYAYHAADLAASPEKYGTAVRNRILMGALYSANDYLQAQRARRLMQQSFAAVMRPAGGFDLLLSPSNPQPAPTYEDGLAANMRRSRSYTRAFNMTGQPSLVVPCGFSGAGLPIGLMLSGRPFEDALVLRAGHRYQQITDWHLRRPALPAAGAG